jgi:hypothetical protein
MKLTLSSRLMVGQQNLDLFIGVRVPARQHIFFLDIHPQRTYYEFMAKINTRRSEVSTTKKITILSIIAAVTILITAFIANGSDFEDAWLYIVALWAVLIPAFEVYSKKKYKK